MALRVSSSSWVMFRSDRRMKRTAGQTDLASGSAGVAGHGMGGRWISGIGSGIGVGSGMVEGSRLASIECDAERSEEIAERSDKSEIDIIVKGTK